MVKANYKRSWTNFWWKFSFSSFHKGWENGQIFREFWGKIGILDSFRRDWCESKCRAAAHQCVNCEAFPSTVNWNTNQFCLEPTQFSWGITIEIVLRYLCRLFSEASGATKPLISPTIHRQWGSFWKYANTGFGTSWKFSLFFRNERPDSLWF